ncbi:MAG: hypothetical protein RI580_17365 [Halothece sp. Uz-M2-17]|nr:hypothetical protein [Halothece sp. Uz-M2-17]
MAFQQPGMNQILNPIRWTIHDLDALPENEGIRREIINGELFVTRAPHWKHQNLINKMGSKLEDWSESHFGFVIPNPGIVPSPYCRTSIYRSRRSLSSVLRRC